ncbi:MAG: XRE family transcriptional regulator [Oscillospiraceae bacterium]
MVKHEKTTDELLNEIKSSKEIESYLSKNETEFAEAQLSEYIELLISEKGLQKSMVVARSGLNRIYAYQILSGKRFPSRDKLIAIGFGLQLSLEEMDELLKYAGFSTLYARNKRDSIIIFAMNSKKSIFALNDMLFENGFEIVTA